MIGFIFKKSVFILTLLFFISCSSVKEIRNETEKTFIILKLDDLWCQNDTVHTSLSKKF